MGEHKGSTIGAKVLHEKEIEQSLPTYGKLKEQIEAVRLSAKAYKISQEKAQYEQDEFVLPQVINNFSILGSRGTGKSSILKTLYQHLKAENAQGNHFKSQRNILLPTIVPENLVENISLMGYILGLLKKFVDQICESHKHRNSLCQPEQHPLGKQYIQLMREFVQLQRPYEEISIQQFSNNSEYVRVMTNMLEAGNQFDIRFRQFIDELVSEYSDDALLFIFIDDIDLSTNRCGDLVKTLLSYLSHPSIVTILAGDISIFGEALTLDFLRQEKIPDIAFLDQSYLVEKFQYEDGSDEEKMLGRKKQLAYEYLKKVMPPNNRHFIVNWSLASKKNFCFIQTDETQEEQKIETLAVLLQRLEQHIPMLKHYFVDAPHTNESDKHTNESDKMGEGKQATLLYYSFDTTARGLVSGYHAIRLLVEKMDAIQASKGTVALEEVYPDIKFLIESLVAANYQLSVNRELIFGQFIDLGNTLENSTVRFDNYSIWLMKHLNNIDQEIRGFQLFVFLDFVARLLHQEKVFVSNEYKNTKQKVLNLLCINGYINEGNLCLNKEERARFSKILETKTDALSSILEGYYDLPFPAAVRYFQIFDIPLFLGVTDEKQEPIPYESYIEYAANYIEVLKSFYWDNQSKLGEYLKEHQKMLEFVENLLNYNQKNMVLSTLCRPFFYSTSKFYQKYISSGCFNVGTKENPDIGFGLKDIVDDYLYDYPNKILKTHMKEYIAELPHVELEDKENGQYIYRVWCDLVRPSGNSDKLNPFYNSYVKQAEKIFDGNGHLNKLDVYTTFDMEYINEFTEQINIISKIDKNDLWNIDESIFGEENYISLIVKYILYQLESLEKKIEDKIPTPVSIHISSVEDSYKEFKKVYTGVSNTLAAKCQKNIENILWENGFKKDITTAQYIAFVLLLNRLIYSNAWYGKDKARGVKAALENCTCNLFDDLQNREGEMLLKQYFFWLHCYCRYRATCLTESIFGVLERAVNAMDVIKAGIQASDDELKTQYIQILAQKLKMNDLEIQKLPKIFELKEKGENK